MAKAEATIEELIGMIESGKLRQTQNLIYIDLPLVAQDACSITGETR